jgi:hypothetical protein
MMRCGVSAVIIVSLELQASAPRSDGVGGEHSAWCIKRAWLLVVEIAATLVLEALKLEVRMLAIHLLITLLEDL